MKNKHYEPKLFYTTVQPFLLFMKPATLIRLFLIVLANLVFFAPSQAQTQFQKAYADAGFNQTPYDLHEVSDGYVYAAGAANTALVVDSTLLFKTDLSGNVVWQRIFPVRFSKFRPVSTGGFILVGSSTPGSIVFRLDNDGLVTWTKTYTASVGVRINDVIETQDGGNQAFLFVGSYNRQFVGGSSGSDFMAIKTDASGNKLWAHCYGRNTFSIGNNLYDYGQTAIETGGTTGNPNYLITGVTNGYLTSHTNELYVVKVDGTNGTMLFDKLYVPLYPVGNPLYVAYNNIGRSIAEDNSGNYAICGGTNNITTIDASGAVQWCKNYSGIKTGNIVKDAASTGFGVGAGYSLSEETALLKIAFNGNVSWTQNYKSSRSLIEATSDNGYLLAGNPLVSNVSKYGYLAVKTNASGQSACYETSESVSTTNVPNQVVNLGGDDIDINTFITVTAQTVLPYPVCITHFDRDCITPTTFTFVAGGPIVFTVTETSFVVNPFLTFTNYSITGANAAWNIPYDTKWTFIDFAGVRSDVTETVPFQYYSKTQPAFANYWNAPVRTDNTLCVDVTRKADQCRVRECNGLLPPTGGLYTFRTSEENAGHETASSEGNNWGEIRLFPNPASGKVQIILPHHAGGKIDILDESGLVVKTFNNVSASEQLDISSLKAGMYLVRVSHTSGVEVSKLQVY